jgi:hypothetical protein
LAIKNLFQIPGAGCGYSGNDAVKNIADNLQANKLDVRVYYIRPFQEAQKGYG